LFTEEECFADEEDDEDSEDEENTEVEEDITAPTLFKKSDSEALLSFCKSPLSNRRFSSKPKRILFELF